MSGGYIRRYTQLPSLIYTLTEQKLTLVDPRSWDDRNDSYYLGLYREKANLRSVLALCFTLDTETYHHWSVFAQGSAGVCIEFKRKEFTEALKAQPGLRVRKVTYVKLTDARRMTPQLDDLPFLKRYAFRHENELRAIYTSDSTGCDTLDIPISLVHVARITLSPWLPHSLSGHLKEIIKGIPDCSRLSVVRSTLISNQEWKNLGREAT